MPPPTPRADLAIRPLAAPAEYDACVALQRATWGDDFRELVPPALLQVCQKVGGLVAGAWDGDRLIGFVFGLTGLMGDRLVHWSHMLAVDETCRDRGIGRALKRYQGDYVLARGIDRMYWTFDPLVARNAHLNLRTLGARVVDYARDLYGTNPMSRTDSVIGSDRFVVEWDLAPLSRGPAAVPPYRLTGVPPLVATANDPLPDAPSVLVAIPTDIQALKRADPGGARAWRRATRRAFEHYLGLGYHVRDLLPHPTGAGSCYLLERRA